MSARRILSTRAQRQEPVNIRYFGISIGVIALSVKRTACRMRDGIYHKLDACLAGERDPGQGGPGGKV
jgi:hypothetical protein